MNVDLIKGIVPPIVIPLDEDERVDEERLRRHVDFVIDGGVSGILAFGSNGEFYMQEEGEMLEILRIIVSQAAGRVPVYMGIGAIRTSKCVRLARLGIDNGAYGVSVLQPMFIKPDEKELYLHFRTIADSIKGTPMLLYNNPGKTGYPISQDVVYRLAHDTENIVGMKDSSGDMTQTSEFIRRNRDKGFKVLCGKDTLIYSGLAVGAVGAVCCTANFLPRLVCSIYERYVAGDVPGSLEAQFRLNPIRLQMDKSSFPVATKDYCNILGENVGRPYLPNLPSDDVQMKKLKQQLEAAGYTSKESD